MNKKRSNVPLYVVSTCCSGVAIVLSLYRPWHPGALLICRLLALISAVAAVILAVTALYRSHSVGAGENVFTVPDPKKRRSVPPPPAMPQGLPIPQAVIGSIQGALHALPGFANTIRDPFCLWQLERLEKALQWLLDSCANGADPAQLADLALWYLPSAMQYLAACAAEGCPHNAHDTLAYIAFTAEQQQDAVTSAEVLDLREAYTDLRQALEQANFCWKSF